MKSECYLTYASILITIILVVKVQSYDLEVYTDSSYAGWAYMDSCVTFTCSVDSFCRVAWTVIKYRAEENNEEGVLTLAANPYNNSSTQECLQPFRSLINCHKEILDSIFSQFSPSRFTSVSCSSFRNGKDYSWNIPIALWAAASPKYTEYRKNYPDTRYSLNALFVEGANATDAYRELRELFDAHGLELKLTSVEKVFTGKVLEVEFSEQLIEKGLSPTDRIFFDVGMSIFSLQLKVKQ